MRFLLAVERLSSRRVYIFLMAVLGFLMLQGCTSTPQYFEPTPIVSAGNSMLYLYRPAASNPGSKPLLGSYPEVMINGVSHGVIRYNEYRSIELAPGATEVRLTGNSANAKWKPRDTLYSLMLQPGKAAYLKFRVEYNMKNMRLIDPSPKYQIGMSLTPASQATQELRFIDKGV
ncbi:MAG: hypothetical protein P8R02_02680 [Pseudomonadales bacterium]|nr:hypothetical protein [Pseudomonadales bacterium]